MSVFVPLGHQKNATAAYLQIRAAILDGTLPTGSQLREAHIATDMGISRSPLREALSRLEEEGLVEKVAFKGAFVSAVPPETIAEIAAVRVVVEPYVIEQALPRLEPQHWQEVVDILTRLNQATADGDASAQIESHLAFHGYFYEKCGNNLLAGLWRTWESRLRLFFVADHSAFLDPRDVSGVHEELVEIIRRGDIDEIRTALRHHIHESPGVEPQNAGGQTAGEAAR
ncbi:GntR family transcriptional regulator [Rhodococcus sp. NPDC056960]|uniref:GntR family transcriptional regulator n=1 Tax=Rhodococcus sp. NPDC056960 TaxID=3345982 RepID=UPI00363D6A8A